MGLWYTEAPARFGITYKIKRTLIDEQTEFQKLELVDTEAFGRMSFWTAHHDNCVRRVHISRDDNSPAALHSPESETC